MTHANPDGIVLFNLTACAFGSIATIRIRMFIFSFFLTQHSSLPQPKKKKKTLLSDPKGIICHSLGCKRIIFYCESTVPVKCNQLETKDKGVEIHVFRHAVAAIPGLRCRCPNPPLHPSTAEVPFPSQRIAPMRVALVEA